MFAVIKPFSISLTAAALWGEVCAMHVLPMGVGPFAFRYQGNGATPTNILIRLERQLIALQLCRWQFYIMKLCSRLFVLYCRNCPKDDKFRYFIPILKKLVAARTLVDGSLESPCPVLVKCNWTLFLSLTVEALQDKMCQNSLPSGGGGSVWATISGGSGRSPANILIPLERQLIALHMQQTFRPLMPTMSKRRQI